MKHRHSTYVVETRKAASFSYEDLFYCETGQKKCWFDLSLIHGSLMNLFHVFFLLFFLKIKSYIQSVI